MKRKNICAEAALREVARKNHTTVEEVRKEIRLAMCSGKCTFRGRKRDQNSGRYSGIKRCRCKWCADR